MELPPLKNSCVLPPSGEMQALCTETLATPLILRLVLSSAYAKGSGSKEYTCLAPRTDAQRTVGPIHEPKSTTVVTEGTMQPLQEACGAGQDLLSVFEALCAIACVTT